MADGLFARKIKDTKGCFAEFSLGAETDTDTNFYSGLVVDVDETAVVLSSGTVLNSKSIRSFWIKRKIGIVDRIIMDSLPLGGNVGIPFMDIVNLIQTTSMQVGLTTDPEEINTIFNILEDQNFISRRSVVIGPFRDVYNLHSYVKNKDLPES